MAAIQKALPTEQSGGVKWKAYILCLFARVCELTGEAHAGLNVLVAAIAEVTSTGVLLWEPELHRLAGILLLGSAAPDAEKCEAHFLRAIDVAWEQQAIPRAARGDFARTPVG